MDNTSESQYGKIIESIDKHARRSDEAFEKLLIALTGVFRLLSGKQPMLATLQGNPEEIQAYVLKLLSELRTMVSDGYLSVKKDVQQIVRELYDT